MTIQSNVDQLILRLSARMKDMQPDSEAMRTAFTRIGILIVGTTQTNIRSKGLIDTGRLINSIRYEFYKDEDTAGIRVGSFGVPYAAVQEFGFNGMVRPHQRTITQVFGKPIQPKRIEVKSYRLNIKRNLYFTNAVKYQTTNIIDILRGAMTGG